MTNTTAMKKHILLLLFTLGLLSKNAFSQSLGFNTPPVFPTSASLNDSIPTIVTLGIKNYGVTQFAGNTPIFLMTQVSNSGTVISLDSMNVINQALIQPAATYNYSYIEPYNSGRFVVGIDVVVIWPKALGASTHDSITYIIQITPQVSVEEMLAENGFAVYPNPCNNTLTIENNAIENPIEQVRVYDMKGVLMLVKNRNEPIDFSQIPDAVYVLEVYFKSGMRKVMRVQKQKDN